eukprot:scaffold7849_cov457-Prasinococcus_capsulatus_cf.AAC.2
MMTNIFMCTLESLPPSRHGTRCTDGKPVVVPSPALPARSHPGLQSLVAKALDATEVSRSKLGCQSHVWPSVHNKVIAPGLCLPQNGGRVHRVECEERMPRTCKVVRFAPIISPFLEGLKRKALPEENVNLHIAVFVEGDQNVGVKVAHNQMQGPEDSPQRDSSATWLHRVHELRMYAAAPGGTVSVDAFLGSH